MFETPSLPLLPAPRKKTNVLWFVLFLVLGIAALVGAAAAGLAVGYGQAYKQRILPGVSVLGVPLDGLTQEQAQRTLEQEINHALAAGFQFKFNDRTVMLPATLPVSNNKENKLASVIRYQVPETAERAFAIGHTNSWWKDGLTQLRLRLDRIRLDVPFTIDRELVENALQEKTEPFLVTVQNAQLTVRVERPGEEPAITVEPERVGTSVNLKPAITSLENEARTLNFQPITLQIIDIQPEWTTRDIEPLANQVAPLLAHAPFTLTTDEKKWTVDKPLLASWLNATTSAHGLTVAIDPARLAGSLEPLLADNLSEPTNGELVMENDKVKSFIAPVDGVAMDASALVAAIESGWANGSTTMPIPLVRKPAVIEGEDAVRLGIREVIGVGKSNFSGSPVNRRKNIALGAKMVNGSLVGPDEEYSLLKILGEIDDKHGWLPELVIKGNKTTPEFGGGLCQIGTTTFRAALATGLPILQRQNHSYRVRYYEPAGTDATIYVPAPDLKFKNDTGNWILISTRIKGDDIAFTVWGTGDGRAVEQTKPKVYNIVPPPEKKIIESLDLPVGTTKCTEVAHAGADALFDYTVTYPSGEIKKVTFTSHYKPWGAVCLLGVTQLSEPAQPSEKVDETGVNNPN